MATEVGRGYDPNMQREDGRIPCCLTVEWTHPDSGEAFEFKSPWFWNDPRTGGDKLEFKDIPVRVVLSDPLLLNRVDLSSYKVELM